jgi:hypothetical protein
MSLRPGTPSDTVLYSILYKWLSVALLIGGMVAVLWVYRDYGIIWDEPNHHSYGEGILAYFSGGMDISIFPVPADGQFTADNAFLIYGGLFDTVVALAVAIFGGDEFETRHLVTALTGVIGIVGAWKLGYLFGGFRAALITALILILEPTYFGMMFNNPKDTPFATGYIWTVYLLIRNLEHLPKISLGEALKLGLAIGWMTGIRVPGVLGIAYFGLIGTLYFLAPSWFSATETSEQRPFRGFGPLVKSGLIIGGICYFLMLLCWPWAQQNPLINPYEAYKAFSAFQFWNGFVLFDGAFTRAADLPRHYLFQYLLVKLPDLMLLSVFLGIGLGAYRLVTRPAAIPRLHLSQHGFLIFAIVFPPTYAILSGAIVYDTVRHFLFIIPVIAVVSGVTLHQLVLLAERTRPRIAPLALAAIALSLSVQLWINVRLHPHQYVYYNSFAGGLAGADGIYETDYWANSYKEAVERMLAFVERTEPEGYSTKEYRVNICGPFLSGAHYLPENFKVVPSPQEADFFVAFTRVNCHKSVLGPTVASVNRMGVLLSVVKDLRTDPVEPDSDG